MTIEKIDRKAVSQSRERLIGLLDQNFGYVQEQKAETLADYLLENDVIVKTDDVMEVKRGHWIDKPTGRYGHVGSWCSVCQQKSGTGGRTSNRHKPFCPNCGAIMNEGETV